MENTSAITFKNVTKAYQTTKGKYGLLTEKLVDVFKIGRKRQNADNFINALKNISFEIKKGEAIGIIGKNGAGKSTILKLISKITYPNKGAVTAKGKIGAFIELGAGLHPELTGRENIFLYGSILGMTKKDILEKFDEIVKFAGIREFLDLPIKKFSTGMYSRLGFSVVAHCDPDILLVDEVLAVGDIGFQKKCLAKMHSFAKERTVVFVSHDLSAIRSICSKVMYINQGRIVLSGKPSTVIKRYIDNQKKLEGF